MSKGVKMDKTKKVEDKIVNVKVGKIDLPKLDVSKYIGKKAKIESANVHEGTYGLYVKFLSNVIDTVGQNEIRASKILGLQIDENGTHGYGDGTKMDLFLKKYKVDDIKKMVGKEIILQSQVTDNGEFLTFN